MNFELGATFGMGKRVIPILRSNDDTPLLYDLRACGFLVRGSPEDMARRVAGALSRMRPQPSESAAR